MLNFFQQYNHLIAGILTIALAVLTSLHVVVYKRDSRSAIAWVGLICLVPVIGSFLYILMGINRIERRASFLRAQSRHIPNTPPSKTKISPLQENYPSLGDFECLAVLIEKMVRKPLTSGNKIKMLINGEQAYPEMLSAIGQAKKYIFLTSYIFNNDETGIEFLDALKAAHDRGVKVYIIIDGAGAHYSNQSMIKIMRKNKIPVAGFLPNLYPWRLSLRKFAQPSKNTGRRRPIWFHWRNEH